MLVILVSSDILKIIKFWSPKCLYRHVCSTFGSTTSSFPWVHMWYTYLILIPLKWFLALFAYLLSTTHLRTKIQNFMPLWAFEGLFIQWTYLVHTLSMPWAKVYRILNDEIIDRPCCSYFLMNVCYL